jgi:hypothetical protein
MGSLTRNNCLLLKEELNEKQEFSELLFFIYTMRYGGFDPCRNAVK